MSYYPCCLYKGTEDRMSDLGKELSYFAGTFSCWNKVLSKPLVQPTRNLDSIYRSSGHSRDR